MDAATITQNQNQKHCACDEPIDVSLSWPDRMSLSYDHVVPLAAGGTHTADNIKPSHLTCNLSKGAKV